MVARGISRYYSPDSIDEASRLLRRHGGVVLAGGQSLMPLLRQGAVEEDAIVDISGIDGYDGMAVTERHLEIGGLVTHARLIDAGLADSPWRSLVETANEIGDIQVRNWGTVGGSLARADPSLDYPPTMMALGAEIEYRARGVPETVPIDEFYTGRDETVLPPDGIITAVYVPRPAETTGVAFEKCSFRRADMAVVNAASSIRLDDDGRTISRARVALGGVESTPRRVGAVEDRLHSREASIEVLDSAAEAIPDAIDPVPEPRASVAYKRKLARNLTSMTLREALSRARGGSRV